MTNDSLIVLDTVQCMRDNILEEPFLDQTFKYINIPKSTVSCHQCHAMPVITRDPIE